MRKRKTKIATALILLIGILSAASHYYMYKSPVFADKFNCTVGFAYRRILSYISGFIPNSVAEFLLFVSPIILIIIIVIAIRKKSFFGTLGFLLGVSVIIYSMFVVGLAPGYRGVSLDKKLALNKSEVSADDLYATEMTVISELNKISEDIDYDVYGASIMPYSLDSLGDKLSSAYEMISNEYQFLGTFRSKPKPLIISEYMTYTHLSGIYTFFTGEANINTNYPDFISAFSSAHEMAHQRGISKEDEANFIAFLVCKNSDDEFLNYCAYLNMYQYLSSALYDADRTLYASAYYTLSDKAKGDLEAYRIFFEKYRENKAADVSDKINNGYLESQGTAGVKSYGMVVDLAVAYYKK